MKTAALRYYLALAMLSFCEAGKMVLRLLRDQYPEAYTVLMNWSACEPFVAAFGIIAIAKSSQGIPRKHRLFGNLASFAIILVFSVWLYVKLYHALSLWAFALIEPIAVMLLCFLLLQLLQYPTDKNDTRRISHD